MATEFTHFLQHLRPLKALAENWDIDLAHELSDYVDVVDRMTQQSMLHPEMFPGNSEQAINFSQAALLIQNSAFIYAKKVQYLYNLTQEAHGSILGYKTKDGSTGKLQNHPAEAPFDVYESPFECLDKMMDLKQLTAAQDSSWKTDPLASAGFLPPATQGYNQSLLPKEYELTSVQGDNIGAKCDFEINDSVFDFSKGIFYSNSFSGEAGAEFVSEPLAELAIEFDFAAPANQGDLVANETSDLKEMPVDQGFDYPTMPDVDYPSSPAPDSPALDAQLPNPVNDTPADPSQQTVENPERSHPLSPIIARCAPASPVRSIQPARKSDQDLAKEQYEAFWKPLDPHANSQLQSRPFRKGQISRSFKLVERIIQERNSKSRYPPPSILEFLSGKQQSVNSSHVQQKSSANSIDLDGLEFEEFEYLLDGGSSRKNKKHAAAVTAATVPPTDGLSANSAPEPIIEIPAEMTTAETGMAQELLNAVGEDDRPDSDDGGFDNNIGGDFYDGGGGFNDNFIADIIGSGVGDANDAADDHGNLFQSFDDLYQLRIQYYLKNAKEFEYQIETSLAKRVRGWENRLFPLMDEQNARGNFDIHEYGEQLLSDLRAISLTTRQKPTKSSVTTTPQIPLAAVMQGKQPFEISRCFLASLHLANEGEVDLSADEQGQMLLQPIYMN